MDGIALEIFTEIWLPHNGLLASKLGKKASTNLGAIQYRRALRSKGATTFGYVPRLAALRKGGGHTALSHLTKLSRSFRSFCGPSVQLCLISGQRGAK
jgi:hypothetical protein